MKSWWLYIYFVEIVDTIKSIKGYESIFESWKYSAFLGKE